MPAVEIEALRLLAMIAIMARGIFISRLERASREAEPQMDTDPAPRRSGWTQTPPPPNQRRTKNTKLR